MKDSSLKNFLFWNFFLSQQGCLKYTYKLVKVNKIDMKQRNVLRKFCVFFRKSFLVICFFKLIFWGWHWLIILCKFLAYNSIVRHLYAALCAHYQSSRLSPSPYVLTPFTLLLFVDARDWLVIFFSCNGFVTFGCQGYANLIKWVLKYLLSLNSERVYIKLLLFLYTCLENYPWNQLNL